LHDVTNKIRVDTQTQALKSLLDSVSQPFCVCCATSTILLPALWLGTTALKVRLLRAHNIFDPT